jgi:hypothetical protein
MLAGVLGLGIELLLSLEIPAADTGTGVDSYPEGTGVCDGEEGKGSSGVFPEGVVVVDAAWDWDWD